MFREPAIFVLLAFRRWAWPTEEGDWSGSSALLKVIQVDDLTRMALAARAGDEDALEHLVDSSYDQVWHLCSSMLGRQSADDLAQEVFLRVVRALPGYRGESSARTWILAVARNTCTDELRSLARRRRRDELAAAGVVRRHTDEPGQISASSDLLRRLDPERRAAFVLTQVIGLSYQEAAEVCGCPTGTIRSRVARAREDLMAKFEPSRTAPASRPTPEKHVPSG